MKPYGQLLQKIYQQLQISKMEVVPQMRFPWDFVWVNQEIVLKVTNTVQQTLQSLYGSRRFFAIVIENIQWYNLQDDMKECFKIMQVFTITYI